MSALEDLLARLLKAGQHPDPQRLDQIEALGREQHEAVVPRLIEMATDERLNNARSDRPEVWAPLHAIRLLGRLRAPEAIEPLLSLMATDDDWLDTELPETYGLIGAPAIAPLQTLLLDDTKDIWTRARAAGALRRIAQQHPHTRERVAEILAQRLMDASASTPDDDSLNAFVVCELMDLQAREAEAAVRAAFEGQRVDTTVVDEEYALWTLEHGRQRLDPDTLIAEYSRPGSDLRLPLTCQACGATRSYDVERVFLDLGTLDRLRRGEKPRYSEFVIPQRIKCPKCGAVDHYELAPMAKLSLTMRAAERDPKVVPIRFGLTDGTPMHPYDARDRYLQQIEEEPRRADLRLKLGNVYRSLRDEEQAAARYREALRIDPAHIEALAGLAQFALDAGDERQARRLLEDIIRQAPASKMPDDRRRFFVEFARNALDHLDGRGSGEVIRVGPRIRGLDEDEPTAPATALSPAPAAAEPRATTERVQAAPQRAMQPPGMTVPAGQAQPRQAPVAARPARKIGRNEPCWCGSGLKYKRCHGR